MYNSGRRYSEPIHMGYSSQAFYEDLFNAPIPGTDILGNPYPDEATIQGNQRIRTPRSDHQQNPSGQSSLPGGPQPHMFPSMDSGDFQLPQMQTQLPESELPSPWLSNPNIPNLRMNSQMMHGLNFHASIPSTIEEEKDERHEAVLSRPAAAEDPSLAVPLTQEESANDNKNTTYINPSSVNPFIGTSQPVPHPAHLQRTNSTPGRFDDMKKLPASPVYPSPHPDGMAPTPQAYNYMYASHLYAQQQMMAQYVRSAYGNAYPNNAGQIDPYALYKQAQAHQYYMMNPHFLTPPHSGNMSVTSSPLNLPYKELPGSPASHKKASISGTPPSMPAYLPSLSQSMAGSMYGPLDDGVPIKVCSNCGCTSTPSWRRCPNGKQLLCNACGLYQKLHNRPRPFCVLDDGSVKVQRTPGTETNICSNCHTTDTPLWRRGSMGEALCNACGLYFKQHRQNMLEMSQHDGMLKNPGMSPMVPSSPNMGRRTRDDELNGLLPSLDMAQHSTGMALPL